MQVNDEASCVACHVAAMGAVSLAGKLPMTLPRIENEMRFSEEQYPGVNDEVLVVLPVPWSQR